MLTVTIRVWDECDGGSVLDYADTRQVRELAEAYMMVGYWMRRYPGQRITLDIVPADAISALENLERTYLEG